MELTGILSDVGGSRKSKMATLNRKISFMFKTLLSERVVVP